METHMVIRNCPNDGIHASCSQKKCPPQAKLTTYLRGQRIGETTHTVELFPGQHANRLDISHSSDLLKANRSSRVALKPQLQTLQGV